MFRHSIIKTLPELSSAISTQLKAGIPLKRLSPILTAYCGGAAPPHSPPAGGIEMLRKPHSPPAFDKVTRGSEVLHNGTAWGLAKGAASPPKVAGGSKGLHEVHIACPLFERITIYQQRDFELRLLCWPAGHQTAIHDHPDLGCLLRVLHGRLRELRYHNDNSKLELIGENVLIQRDIGYQEGNRELHSIIALEDSYSLHVYSPPNYQCKVYSAE